MESESLANLVRRLIDADPDLRRCLELGIVNYSEVARRLKKAVEEVLEREVSVEAVKAAVVRYARRLREEGGGSEVKGLLKVLAASSLELRTDIVVATVRLTALPRLAAQVGEAMNSSRLLLLLQATNTVTVIGDREAVEKVIGVLEEDEVIEVQEGQAVIVVRSPREVVDTPGFMAYVTGLLASNGINISQVESVYTDTVIVLEHRDALRAFTLLDQAIRMARTMVAGDRV